MVWQRTANTITTGMLLAIIITLMACTQASGPAELSDTPASATLTGDIPMTDDVSGNDTVIATTWPGWPDRSYFNNFDIFGSWTVVELRRNGTRIPDSKIRYGYFGADEHHFSYTPTTWCVETPSEMINPENADSETVTVADTVVFTEFATLCITTCSLAHDGRFYHYDPATKSGQIDFRGTRQNPDPTIAFTPDHKLLVYRIIDDELLITATDETDTWTLRCQRSRR